MSWFSFLLGVLVGLILHIIISIPLKSKDRHLEPYLDTRTMADDNSQQRYGESPEDWNRRVKISRERLRNK